MFPQPTQSYRTTACNDNGQFPVKRQRVGSTGAGVLQLAANSGLISLTYVADRVFIISGAQNRLSVEATSGTTRRSA